MKVYIIYQSDSDHARRVEEYVHDFRKEQVTRKVDLLDVNTEEGARQAELYDVVQYPAVLALANDGQILKSWQGEFPLMNELAYYANGE
ncbi:MAG TPA: hypothetical protein VJC09_01470 [Candidatus Saccharimonadales bacterium]|nr:hypothetical protein [Candidatus Saccharimonadales bacterium]